MEVMWLDHDVDQGVGGGRMEEVGRLEIVLTMVMVVAVWPQVVGLVKVITVVVVAVMGRRHVMLEMLSSSGNTVVIIDGRQ